MVQLTDVQARILRTIGDGSAVYAHGLILFKGEYLSLDRGMLNRMGRRGMLQIMPGKRIVLTPWSLAWLAKDAGPREILSQPVDFRGERHVETAPSLDDV